MTQRAVTSNFTLVSCYRLDDSNVKYPLTSPILRMKSIKSSIFRSHLPINILSI